MMYIKFSRKVEKILAGLVIAAMIITMLPSVFVIAATDTINYSYDGYEIEYTVTGEWEGGQSVEVRVTNTGDASILNWAFKFDAGGEINNLWNATVIDNKDNEYVIKNNGWNYEIKPGESVNFGYIIINGSFGVPDKFELCSERVNITNGYDVQVNIINSWDTGVKGEFIITNTSDSPIEAWTLAFDTNFTIDNIWNAKILESADSHYIIASEIWTNPIPAGGSETVGFVGTKLTGNEEDVSNFSLTSVINNYTFMSSVEGNIELYTPTGDICAASGYQTVYFYALSEMDITELSLIDTKNNEIVATMYDDGNYLVSGDDIQGDGIFTCKLLVDISTENDYQFVARYVGENIEIISNSVEVCVYEELTDKEIEEMDEVDSILFDWVNSSEFSELTLEQKEAETYELLLELSKNGSSDIPYSLIIEESICHNEDSGAFTFSYSCGVYGVVNIIGFSEYTMGTATENTEFNLSEQSAIDVVIDKTISKELPEKDISVLILYGIDDITLKKKPYFWFKDTKAHWESKGIDVEMKVDVTINDFKEGLAGNTFIAMETHGECYRYFYGFPEIKSVTVPVIHTVEFRTKAKDEEYSDDLKTHRIAKGVSERGKIYYILPEFFDYYYTDNELEESIVFMGNCCGFGRGDKENTAMAEALCGAGAEVVVGFHESVLVEYGNLMVTTFVDKMAEGMSAEEALDVCKATYGENDHLWLENAYGEEALAAVWTGPAYPVIYGNEDAALWNIGIKNESFEGSIFTRLFGLDNISAWKKEGDTRLVRQLGNISAVDGRYMAMITTGVGSAESEYFAGTEGSSISQFFKIPEGSKTLSFAYNVVSEEPMEFINSGFDDRFFAKIFDVNDNEVMEVASESIDSSEWHTAEGIDFDGGDSTVYFTGWKKVVVDVSKCAGAYVTLSFNVVDVGDSAYDTAALIDNIVLQ